AQIDIDIPATLANGDGFGLERDFPTPAADVVGEGRQDFPVADDSSGGHMQGLLPDNGLLPLGELTRRNGADRNAMFSRPRFQRTEALNLKRRGRDDELAAFLKGDVVALAKVLGHGHAGAAEPGLEAARRIIDARMDDARIPSRLVAA